ncbi:MAG: tandem-95 repeat protein, partial [Planctomycetes bacterium]|nr:tandem-95 repeat protein [Planctomycetota bacterium]
LVWHPAADANGTLQAFTVKAWDGQAASATAVPVNVAVAPANDAPVAQDGGFGVEEDGSHSGSLAATDVDGDPLTFAIVSGPANGALTAFDPATGAYTYEPADDYRGPDSFTFKANDATVDSNEATITITVTPMNDAPVAQDGAFSVPEDGSHSGSAVAADTEADPLTYAVVTGPAHGSLTAFDTATGAFTYEPADDYHGPDSFTFKANDGMEDSNEATVTIAVTPVNDEPAFGGPFPSDPTVLLVGQPYAFALAAGDVDGDTLAYSLAAGPAWLSVDPATGVLSGTPNRRAHVGGSTVTVRVDDGQGGNDEHSFGLTVQGQVITLGSAIPVPLTKVAYTDASGDLASVGAKAKVGVFYLVRGVAPGPGGAYSLTTPGDLVAIEGEGTDAKAGLSIKLKAAVTGQVPATSVTDIAVNGSFNLSAPAMGLLGNMSVTGGVGRFAIGDVAAQHAITIGLDPLIKGTSLVFGRVRDATLASLSPLRLLSAIEWLDTDATPDQVVAPWIASLATRGSKTIGGPRGDFEAGLALSGAGALKGTLGKVSIAGSLNRAAWTITGSAGAIAVRGDLTNASIVADLLGSVAVTGRISQDGTDGDADVIRALSGGFSVRDLTGTWWIALAQDHLFSTLRAFVG